MRDNTALTVMICTIAVCLAARYTAPHLKFVATNENDVQVAKIKADAEIKLDQQQKDFNSRDTNTTITERRQRCILDLKNNVGAQHPNFSDLVASTCK